MKNKLTVFSRSALIFFTIALAFFSLPAAAQVNQVRSSEIIIPPAEETFVEVDAIASSWRVGRCPNPFFKITDCHNIIDMKRGYTSSIYNKDGSLWRTYSSLRISNPDYWKKNKPEDFLPFADFGIDDTTPLFRLVRESANWYEIEINEKTRETKFVLKSDPDWVKQSWDFWLAKMDFLYVFDKSNTRFFDKPNGKVIEREEGTNFDHLRYLGIRDGDWIFVKVSIKGIHCNPEQLKKELCYDGWFRWRDGRKLFMNGGWFVLTDTEINTN